MKMKSRRCYPRVNEQSQRRNVSVSDGDSSRHQGASEPTQRNAAGWPGQAFLSFTKITRTITGNSAGAVVIAGLAPKFSCILLLYYKYRGNICRFATASPGRRGTPRPPRHDCKCYLAAALALIALKARVNRDFYERCGCCGTPRHDCECHLAAALALIALKARVSRDF